MISTTLSIKKTPIGELLPHPCNPRTHSNKQKRRIAKSIKKFGFTNPILIDSAGYILAGEGLWEAAKLLSLSEVPTICLDHLSEAEQHAYLIADNRLAELAGWDMDILAEDLSIISTLDVGFDLTATGFDTPQIDLLLNKGCGKRNDYRRGLGSRSIWRGVYRNEAGRYFSPRKSSNHLWRCSRSLNLRHSARCR